MELLLFTRLQSECFALQLDALLLCLLDWHFSLLPLDFLSFRQQSSFSGGLRRSCPLSLAVAAFVAFVWLRQCLFYIGAAIFLGQ